MNAIRVKLTTDTAGAGTIYSRSILGKLHAIKYIPGSLATGTDLTITNGDNSKPVLTKTDAGTSVVWFYPRDLVNGVADGAALTGTSGGDRTAPICDGTFKIVIAQGGGVTTDGILTFYVEE